VKIVVDQARLSQRLQAVCAVVPTKTTLSVLSNVLFSAEGNEVRLTATDLDLSMTTSLPAKVEEAGKACIPSKRILEIVRSLPALEVKLSVKGNAVRIQCGKSASAVGDAATSAVVTSIVLIVVTDGIFAVLFNALGI
jgi:DNA polymerase-3 subunit beta